MNLWILSTIVCVVALVAYVCLMCTRRCRSSKAASIRPQACDLPRPTKVLGIRNQWRPGQLVRQRRPDFYPGYGYGYYPDYGWGYVDQLGRFEACPGIMKRCGKDSFVAPPPGYVVPLSLSDWHPAMDPFSVESAEGPRLQV